MWGDKLLTSKNIHVLLQAVPQSHGINDYKFFCFNGAVKFMKIDFDRYIDHHANYYDCNFNLLDLREADFSPVKDRIICRPIYFEKMIELAERISQHKRFVRVDFYEVDNHIYFGEITFYPASGTGKFVPENADYRIGRLLQL